MRSSPLPARRPRRTARTLLLCVWVLGQVGCGGGWHAVPLLPPGPANRDQAVEVWIAGRPLQLHAVQVDRQAVSGVPLARPVDCDSCRVTLPLGGVDSMRVSNPPASLWKTIGLTLGGTILAILVVCTAATTCKLGI